MNGFWIDSFVAQLVFDISRHLGSELDQCESLALVVVVACTTSMPFTPPP